MYWQTAPAAYGEDGSGPCPGESGTPLSIPGMVVHAYDPNPSVVLTDPDPDVEGDETYQIATTCLVGTLADESARVGWVLKTLAEAKTIFENIHTIAPTATEVF